MCQDLSTHTPLPGTQSSGRNTNQSEVLCHLDSLGLFLEGSTQDDPAHQVKKGRQSPHKAKYEAKDTVVVKRLSNERKLIASDPDTQQKTVPGAEDW